LTGAAEGSTGGASDCPGVGDGSGVGSGVGEVVGDGLGSGDAGTTALIGAKITQRAYHSDGPRLGVTALRRQPGV